MENKQSRPQQHAPEDVTRRRRAQLDKQTADMIACSFHAEVRYSRKREKGCPKCEHLFNQGLGPDGRFLPGVSGNPKGRVPGFTELRSLMKRYMMGRDVEGRTKQELIARLIVEGAVRGEQPFLAYVMERFDQTTSKTEIEVDDKRAPAEAPTIPDDDERDAQVALILASLEKDGTPEDLLEKLERGPEDFEQ